MHLVLKYPNSREKYAPLDEGIFFDEQYLGLARKAVGDWVIWYLPKRAGLSEAGIYHAVALAGNISVCPDDSRRHFMQLSRFEKLDRPLRAVSQFAIYEEGLAKPERKSKEQKQIRELPDQEFVNILEDCLSQVHFSATPRDYEEHGKREALLRHLVGRTRERIRNTFPGAS